MGILETKGLGKNFGENNVFRNADIELESGLLTVLGGINGSGKSILVKTISGDILPDSGKVIFEGSPVDLTSIAEARRLGISAIYQEYMLVPDLTVAENILLGSDKFTISRRKMNDQVSRFLEQLGLEFDPSSKVSSFSSDDQVLLEFAVAAFSRPKVLILDDLFSFVRGATRVKLLEMIDSFKKGGVAVLVTTSDPEVMVLGDRLFFMDYSGIKPLPLQTKESDIWKMLGVSPEYSVAPVGGEPLIDIDNLADTGLDLRLKRGEVLCISCDNGVSVREFTRALTRQDPFSENSVAMLREAKNFFERFSSRGHSSEAEKYFSSNVKNTGLVSQIMLKKSRKFTSNRSLKKSFILNRESLVSVKSFLAGLGRAPGFSGLMRDDDTKLSHLRFDACDLFIFIRPLIGLDPVSTRALAEVLQEIADRSKAAVVISDEIMSRKLCTRIMNKCN